MNGNQITSKNTPTFKRGTCACEKKHRSNQGRGLSIRKVKSGYPIQRRQPKSFQTVKSRFLNKQRTI